MTPVHSKHATWPSSKRSLSFGRASSLLRPHDWFGDGRRRCRPRGPCSKPIGSWTQFDESRPLKPWLFRIAHNRCIDFLRRKGVRDEAELAAAVPEATETAEPTLGTGKAVEHLVLTLPPKSVRVFCLKDVFDYSLEEIAELVDSTVGGVKAALNRARTKLASSPPLVTVSRSANPTMKRVMQLYVDRFNRRDWDGVRELISADARLNVAERFVGKFADAPYFFNYNRWPWPWKLAVGELDGEPVVSFFSAARTHGRRTQSFVCACLAIKLTESWTTFIVPGWFPPRVPSQFTNIDSYMVRFAHEPNFSPAQPQIWSLEEK